MSAPPPPPVQETIQNVTTDRNLDMSNTNWITMKINKQNLKNKT